MIVMPMNYEHGRFCRIRIPIIFRHTQLISKTTHSLQRLAPNSQTQKIMANDYSKKRPIQYRVKVFPHNIPLVSAICWLNPHKLCQNPQSFFFFNSPWDPHDFWLRPFDSYKYGMDEPTSETKVIYVPLKSGSNPVITVNGYSYKYIPSSKLT